MLPARWTKPDGQSEAVPFSFEADEASGGGVLITTLGRGREHSRGRYVLVQQSTQGHGPGDNSSPSGVGHRGRSTRLCALVMTGVRPDGTKELIVIEDAYRESTESWAVVLRALKRRGMRALVLAVGDGALGFW